MFVFRRSRCVCWPQSLLEVCSNCAMNVDNLQGISGQQLMPRPFHLSDIIKFYYQTDGHYILRQEDDKVVFTLWRKLL